MTKSPSDVIPTEYEFLMYLSRDDKGDGNISVYAMTENVADLGQLSNDFYSVLSLNNISCSIKDPLKAKLSSWSSDEVCLSIVQKLDIVYNNTFAAVKREVSALVKAISFKPDLVLRLLFPNKIILNLMFI